MKSIDFFHNTAILLTIIAIMVASNIYTLIPIYSAVAEDMRISESNVVLAGGLFTFFYACGLYSFILLTGASLAPPAAAALPFEGVLQLISGCSWSISCWAF